MSDAFLANVTSLLHFTDDDISDSAFSDYTWHRTNTLLNTNGKFGGNCLQLNGNGSFLTSSLKAIAPYTGNFTAEAFISISGLPTTTGDAGSFNTIYSFAGTNSSNMFSWNFAIYSPSSGSAAGFISTTIGSASGHSSSGATNVSINYPFLWNTFYHVAFVKNGTTGTLYVNGNAVTSNTVPSSFFNAAAGASLMIGNNNVNSNKNYFNGLISEARITNVARYTSNFTPDTTYYDSPITYTRAYPINQTFTSGVPANFASYYDNTLSTQGYNGTDALTMTSTSVARAQYLKINTIPYSKSFTCSFNMTLTADNTTGPVNKSVQIGLLTSTGIGTNYTFYHYNNIWRWLSNSANTPYGASTQYDQQTDTTVIVPGTITVTNNTPITLTIKVYPISSNSFNSTLSSVEFFVNGLPVFRTVINDDYYVPVISTGGNNSLSLFSVVGDEYVVGSSYPYSESFTSNIPVGTGMHLSASGTNFSESWISGSNIILDANTVLNQHTWTLNKLDYLSSFTFTANMYISTDASNRKHGGIILMPPNPNGTCIRIAHLDNSWDINLISNALVTFTATPYKIYDLVGDSDIATPIRTSVQEVEVSYDTYDGYGYVSLKVNGVTLFRAFGLPANVYKPGIFLYGCKVSISNISAVASASPPDILGNGTSANLPQGIAYGAYGKRIIPSEIKTLPLPTILRTKNYYYTGTGSISGIVISNNVPLSNCIVKLFDKSNGTLLESVYSDNGYFIFHQYDTNEHQYYTVAETINDSWVVPNISTGSAAITGFLEGIDVPTLVTLTDETNNSTVSSLTTMDYSFGNCVEGRQYFVKYNGAIKEVTTSLNMVRGYLTGNVSTNACTGSNFAIKCYRSDGMFIGLYPLVDSSYTIPNLDVLSLYDIVLFDLNTILESQILSKRIPTAYDEGYTPPTLITNTDGILITTTDGTYITTT